MSYCLKPKADIESFSCNMWGFAFLQDLLSLVGADLTEFSIFNDAQEVSGAAASRWGKLLEEKKEDLAIAEVRFPATKHETQIPLFRKWSEDEAKRHLVEIIARGSSFDLQRIRPLTKEEIEFIDRFSKFLSDCGGYTQY